MKNYLLLLALVLTLPISAQIYPFADGFQTYSNFTTLGTQGGYLSDMSVYQTHGMGNSDKGLIAQMSNFNLHDSTVSPLIGTVTTLSEFSFFYRIMNTGAQYPFVPTTIGTGDAIEVYAGIQTLNIYQLIFTVNSLNHIADTAFKKVKIPVPSTFAGQSGNFKIVVRHPANGNDFFVDIDSLVLKDSVSGPAPLTVDITSTSSLCQGSCSGTLYAATTGGVPPYSYDWSEAAFADNDTILNVCDGTYTVTVTDNGGGSASASVTLTSPPTLTANATSANVACYGDSTGSINLSVSGGTPVYEFIWSNSSTIEDPQNLTAGNYDVTVLDANNCSTSASISLTQPSSPLSFTTSITDPSFHGAGDGSIVVTPSGGTVTYVYSVNNGVTYSASNTFNFLVAGCYFVYVKDVQNCDAGPDTVCLTDPPLDIESVNRKTLSVYPNPASTFLAMSDTHALNGEVSIFNILGEQLIISHVAASDIRIDISALAEGNYIFLCKTDLGSIRKSFSIVR